MTYKKIHVYPHTPRELIMVDISNEKLPIERFKRYNLSSTQSQLSKHGYDHVSLIEDFQHKQSQKHNYSKDRHSMTIQLKNNTDYK
jgi:phage terminase large subunit